MSTFRGKADIDVKGHYFCFCPKADFAGLLQDRQSTAAVLSPKNGRSVYFSCFERGFTPFISQPSGGEIGQFLQLRIRKTHERVPCAVNPNA